MCEQSRYIIKNCDVTDVNISIMPYDAAKYTS